MNKLYIITQFCCGFIFLLFQQCTPNASAPQEHHYNHPDGSLRRRYFMVNNQIEGEMTEYYPKTGQIQVKRQFKKGIQTGRTLLFYPDGKLKEVQYYEDGKKQKGDTIFYSNGKPQFLVTFKNGKMDGYMRKWTEDGELFFEARYQQDSLKEVTKIMQPKPNIR
jgi:antitoxin component YwqK of YwqJK toxin-antitoxin module